MLVRFHSASARKRRTDETQAYGIELARRQLRRRVARPEAVPVAGDNREARNFLVAHKVVYLGALPISRSIVAATHQGIGRLRPCLLCQSRRKVLRVAAPIRRAFGIAPNLPGRSRSTQLVLEPRLLGSAEDRLRRRVLSRVRNARAIERDFVRRLAAIEGAAPIKNLGRILREHAGEFWTKAGDRFVAKGIGTAVTMLVGDDEIEMPTVAVGAIADQAVDRCEIVGLEAEAVLIPLLDRHILDRWRSERLERSARRSDTRRQILEPCLVGGDLDALSRAFGSSCLLDALPPLPGEFGIVPHRHERPASPRILQVWIGKIAAIDDAVAVDRQRIVELADLAAIGDPRDLVNRTVVPCLHFFGVFDDLVDEIAEVQDKTELVRRRRPLVLEDHPAVGVELAFVDVLAANESEAHRSVISLRRSGPCPTHATSIPLAVGKAIPVHLRRLESTRQHAERPVRLRRNSRRRAQQDPPELRVFGHLNTKRPRRNTRSVRPSSPQQNAAMVWVARSDALWKHRPSLTPRNPRCTRYVIAPRRRSADAQGCLEKRAAIDARHGYPPLSF